jgi:uncharacterized NAD-dependent epimerase/dehydratase family protein
MSQLETRAPYLLFLGDTANELDAKTAQGLVYWRPEECVAQLRFANCRVDTGLPDMDIRQARRAGARSLVIGVAPTGGAFKSDWESTLVDAMDSGMDIISGMHTRLGAVPKLANAAYRNGVRLIDLREPPEEIPIATGKSRSGRRLLTVGTDCCVGKKYTALAVHRALRQAGVPATFRATGQTGILIAGAGIPIDAVVADFVSGAAELLSPPNQATHWDIVEGQGSLFHPAYAAVTLGLVHGTQPDALVLCHEPGRTHIDDYPHYAMPDLRNCIERYEQAAQLTNPESRCIAVSVNTRTQSAAERQQTFSDIRQETGLHAFDPMAAGIDELIDALQDWGSP